MFDHKPKSSTKEKMSTSESSIRNQTRLLTQKGFFLCFNIGRRVNSEFVLPHSYMPRYNDLPDSLRVFFLLIPSFLMLEVLHDVVFGISIYGMVFSPIYMLHLFMYYCIQSAVETVFPHICYI